MTKHKAKDLGGWPTRWACACGWRPTRRSLGIARGYVERTAVSLHVVQKAGRLCECGCEDREHVAGHGACKGETRFMGPPCECRKFRARSRA